MSQSRPTSARHQDRLVLGDAAIFSLAVAVGLLPGKDQDARRWLMDRGLVRNWLGRPVVVWADVVAALRAGDEPVQEARPMSPPLVRASLEPLK